MAEASGELYFLSEFDLETQNFTKYVKIGIVKNDRSTEKRIDEHQTGNPREIRDVKVILSPQVSKLEKLLHGVFQRQCVGGEWFELVEETLTEAIDFALEQAAELRRLEQVVSEVESFGKTESTEEELPSDEAIRDLAHRFYFLQQSEKKLKDVEDAVIKKIADLEDLEVRKGLLSENERLTKRTIISRSPSFSKADFKSQELNLYLKFCESLTVVKQKALSINKDIKKEVEEGASFFPEWNQEQKEISQLIVETSELIDDSSSQGALENLMVKRCELMRFRSLYGFRKTNFEYHLKHACGTASGIKGVCTWERVLGEKEVFDEMRFKEEHPDKHAEYMKSGKSYSRTFVMPGKRRLIVN